MSSFFEDEGAGARTPSDNDYSWLLSTVKELCYKSDHSDWYQSIHQQLLNRGFVPPNCSKSYPVPRVASPFAQVYNNIEVIGEGGYGKVYKIQNLIDKQIYALKCIPIVENEIPTSVREIQCLAQLNSPRVVRYFSSWVKEGKTPNKLSLFIQMEYVSGTSLREYLDKRSSVDFNNVLYYIREMAKALCDIHAAGIVHRDFRPENIMIRSNGGICVIDFGISSIKKDNSKPVGQPSSFPTEFRCGSLKTSKQFDQMCIMAANQRSNTVEKAGTPMYSSPHQLNGGVSGPRDDMYSFGIVIFEMLAGFKTYMERAKAIMELRNQKTFPKGFVEEHPMEAELILQLIDPGLQSRPSAKSVLKSGIFARMCKCRLE